MQRRDTDRNLLFGILALQMDFVTRDGLVAAMNAWAVEKHRPIGELLVERGSLDPRARALLDPMVDLHVARHGGDPGASLAALSSVEGVASAVRRSVADPDILASLATVAPTCLDDPFSTRTHVPNEAPPSGSRYHRGREHARGNLGVVFVARDTELNREVALKEIQDRHADHPHHRSRFLLEAEVTGGLEHPGIVPVYGLGHHVDGRPFYTMRFIKGDSLTESIAHFHADDMHRSDPGRRNLALQKLLRRFTDVCNAIDYAHSRGVLHRDLKPHNVMVGRYGETLVVDWGLAKATGTSGAGGAETMPEEALRLSSSSGSAETMPGALVGTPAYMSPEQAAGRLDLLGPASDVYGLGATLYHLLAGRAPIAGNDLGELLHKVQSGDFPPPRAASPWLDPALEAICLKAMALKPDARYATPRALAEDVERWTADEPVLAWREPWSRRCLRWARRNRSGVVAAAGTLVLVSVVSVVAAILIEGARRDARASLNAESIARAEAGRRLIQARESIDTLLTGVGEGLSQIPGAQKVRRQLLDKAAAQYARLAAEKGNDPALRFESASAHDRLGSIRVQLGDLQGAEADFRAAESELSGIARPGGPDVDRLFGQARANLGQVLMRQGQLVEAEKAYRRAIDGGLSLLKDRPDDRVASTLLGGARRRLADILANSSRLAEAEVLHRSAVSDLEAASKTGEYKSRYQLADAHDAHARLLQKLGRAADAEASFRAAIATASETVRLFPEEFAARSQLAISQRNFGSLLVDIGRGDEAERLYLASLSEREAIARANPDVPSYRFFRASSRAVLGTFYKDRNRYREAEGAHRAAIADLQALVKDHPADQEYRNRLGITRAALGSLLMAMGRNREAEDEVRLANDDHRALWDASPTMLLYGSNLGNGLNNQARILRRLGRLDEAEATFRAGLAVYERLAKDQPTVPGHRDMIALISNNVANLLAQRHRFEPAVSLARKAVAGYEALTRDHPKELDYAESLVMSRNTLGEVLVHLGSKEEALAVLSESGALARTLVSAHPDVPLLMQRLIEGKLPLAGLEADLGRFEAALATLEDASQRLGAELARHPESAEYRRMLWEIAAARADVSLKAGRPARAAEALETLLGEPCHVGSMPYNVACLYARAATMTVADPAVGDPERQAQARGYLDRAVAFLHRAVELGFRDARQFNLDEDLNPLRSRADFRLLMLDLPFPARPFAR